MNNYSKNWIQVNFKNVFKTALNSKLFIQKIKDIKK